MLLIPLVLSLSVHEWAHAAAARVLGDDTAERLGRLTLNPISHIDPIGTILLPMLGIPFGWAKPVPFNPIRFKRKYSMTTGTMLVAIAGPISNIVIAVISLFFLALLSPGNVQISTASSAIVTLLHSLIFLNILLACFNMIPVPPLDGSYVADAFMPKALRPYWEAFRSLGYGALLFILIGPLLLGINLFHWPMEVVGYLIGVVN